MEKTMGDKLRQMIFDRQIVQKDIVRSTGISHSQLSLLVKGRKDNINLRTLEKLCRFFHCTPNDLLPWELWNPTTPKT